MRVDQDHYAVLGVARPATRAEIRRAFRLLALKHHPDRAGAAATATFQRIALAYRVLSDPPARSAYDAELDRIAAPPPAPTLRRFVATLETLLASGAARVGGGGVIELLLTAAEAETGGTVAITLPWRAPCPTCGGCAQAGSVWCTRCEYAGTVPEEVTACIAIPPVVPEGTTFIVRVDPEDASPPLRVRVRL